MTDAGSTDYLTFVYGAYALLSVVLTIFLARTLSLSGRVFLAKVFESDEAFGDAVNRLLVVGFYLVNLGYACVHLVGGHAPTVREAIETLATKVGWLLLALAAMHFANLFVFHVIRRSSQPPRRSRTLPLAPHGQLEPEPFAAAPTAR
jgi:hypothetical protein